MRSLYLTLLFALVISAGGALLAPGLHWLAQHAAREWPALCGLAHQPLHRYVLRSMLLITLVGLWPFLRSLGMRSWAEVGLSPRDGQWTRLGGGFALGFGSLACAAGLALVCGGRQLDGGLTGAWWGRLPGIAATAVVVSVLEESIFRGALFGGLRRTQGWKPALLLSSVVYAAVHYLQVPESPGDVHWRSGLELLPQMARGLVRMDLIVPGLLALAVTGAVLALAFQQTGSLYFSIGLHAGWVFWLRSYNFMTDRRPDTAVWFWGTGKLYDGWLALAALAVAGFVVWKLPRTKPSDGHAPEAA